MNERIGGKGRIIAFTCVVPVLGLMAYIVPVFVVPLPYYADSLFPLVRSGVEGTNTLTYFFLFMVGVVAGTVLPRTSAWLCGLLAIGLLPVLALIEAEIVPGTHNLLPFEFFFYGLAALPAIAGAAFIRWVPHLWRPEPPAVR